MSINVMRRGFGRGLIAPTRLPGSATTAGISCSQIGHPKRVPRYPAKPSRFGFPTRSFAISATTSHGHIDPPKPGFEIKVTFIEKDGHENLYEVSEGDNLLDIAQANDLEMEGAWDLLGPISACLRPSTRS